GGARGCLRGRGVKAGMAGPPWFPVPPTGYGGIEWIVWLLAEGLTAQGHEVTLFASGDSRTNAKLEAVYPTAPSELIGRTMPDLRHLLHALQQAGGLRAVHRPTSAL